MRRIGRTYLFLLGSPLRRRSVGPRRKGGRRVAALANGEDAVPPGSPQRLRVEDLYVEAGPLAPLGDALGEDLRTPVAGGLVHEVPRDTKYFSA